MVEIKVSTESGIEIHAENCSVMEILQIFANTTEAFMGCIEKNTGEKPEPLITAAFKASLNQREDFANYQKHERNF